MLTLSDHQRVLNDLYLTRVNYRFPNKPVCHIKSQLSYHNGMIVNMLTYGRGQGKITRAEDRNEHFDDVAHRAVIQRQVPGTAKRHNVHKIVAADSKRNNAVVAGMFLQTGSQLAHLNHVKDIFVSSVGIMHR